MAANRGVGTLFLVLLLSSWPETNLQPINTSSDKSSELLSAKSLDDVATVFDEILVQEILDPVKLAFLEMLRPVAVSPTGRTKKKKARLKENYDSTPRKLENWFSSGHTDRLFSDEEEKETLFQIKSLSALEKIIDSLQRVLRESLQKKRQLHASMLRARYRHRGRRSLP
ncbi:sperm acrosome-associated protein 7-like isoform X2 [Fukomys damarensis]|uniref:sperm acrosome-associated protein 7-like isoform X2 n=1 Tax=Fukomys damarensis TaxID=885580 RepID=UPI00053FD191|nr:sperm acrosome-associated protein 7-like isoform X2 [Fukomys damarensis]